MAAVRDLVTLSRRIVIKVGTRVATEGDNAFAVGVIGGLVRQIAALKGSGAPETPSGRSFILVSSGAIALGLNRMGLAARPKEITLLQAAAAMGQSRLMHAYEREFESVRQETAQILLTYEDIRSRARYLNIRNTIFTLWSFGVVPIVNENDTVSFAEIRFGDNDILAAHLASMIGADLLIILTDTEGLYDRNPKTDPGARMITTVERVSDALMEGAKGKGSSFSSGGMESKLRAADIATRGGIGVVIAKGRGLDLPRILAGDGGGTYFVPVRKRIRGRKKWIASNTAIEGAIVVDKGAERAIVRDGRSLLPAGVKEVSDAFPLGGVISIRNEEGREIARGLTNFSSEELAKIRGLNTRRIPEVLGVDAAFEEVVHRDNMVITA